MTLSCKVGSITLRPEWLWRARSYTIVPEESAQYWYLFWFPPPPDMHVFHLLSDQWGQYRKYFWRFSSSLQNWTAPSSSRCNWSPWRRRWINFFDTSQSESEYSPGSTSVQILWPIGIVLVDELANLVFVVLLLPLIGLQNHLHSISTHTLRTACGSEVSFLLLFKFVTYLFQPWEIVTEE